MDALERYIREMSTPQHETLAWVERQSWLQTSHGRQVSGPEVGALLRTLVRLMQARRVLEIGTFSGYATLWMAEALPEDGRIDTIEINDEMEDLIREGFERAGLSDRLIVDDNVLWDGKVYGEDIPRDQQTRGILAFNDLVAGDTRVENFILPLRDGLNIIRKK